MTTPPRSATLFAALLKYWRGLRGMTQLDLALAADVSTRHLSYLENGRAKPSREMVLVLGAKLDLPLREQNAFFEAAGFAPPFPEPSVDGELDPPIAFALERMFAHHEPYPMVAMNRRYDILRHNHGFAKLIAPLGAEALSKPLNAFHMLFDPALARPLVVDWPRTARALLSRLHRESLHRPKDPSLASLLEEMLAYPDVPAEWRQPDFATASLPTFSLGLRWGGATLRLLTTVTAFSAPGNVTLEELQIEAYFPLDEATERTFESMRAR
ncbi:MAG: helix-turn-helix transcriptional regulator [Myxococcota bacterium]